MYVVDRYNSSRSTLVNSSYRYKSTSNAKRRAQYTSSYSTQGQNVTSHANSTSTATSCDDDLEGKQFSKSWGSWAVKKVNKVFHKKDNEGDDIDIQAVRYRPPGLDNLCNITRFSKNELRIMYRGFKQECPTGIVNEDTFKEIYAQFFPCGDSNSYAHFVFSTFDTNHDGTVSFEDFVTGLSTLARGSFNEKVQWAFGLYDVNGDGIVTKEEMLDIMLAVYDLIGKTVEPTIEENTAKDHVDRIFDVMDTNQDGVITIEEFIEACRKDRHICKSMNIFDTIL